MDDYKNSVLVGNILLRPHVLRNYLAKSYYWLTYEPKGERLTLNANHGGGGEVLFEIRNVSYESAEKLAEGLGLEKRNECTWAKWNPVLTLYHDGSTGAEKLWEAILKSGIPFSISSCEKGKFGFADGSARYASPMFTTEQMKDKILEMAERYKDELGTKP